MIVFRLIVTVDVCVTVIGRWTQPKFFDEEPFPHVTVKFEIPG